jgi:hypothetical protein
VLCRFLPSHQGIKNKENFAKKPNENERKRKSDNTVEPIFIHSQNMTFYPA